MKTVGKTVYMNAHSPNGYYGSGELWKSDGTAAGTVPVRPVAQGGPFEPRSFADLNGTAFLSADGPAGRELWKSDGTSAGTVMVKDIAADVAPEAGRPQACVPFSPYGHGGGPCATPLPPIRSSNPNSLTPVNGRLFFTADDGIHGRELWVTDGTESGTHMVKDINLYDDVVPGTANLLRDWTWTAFTPTLPEVPSPPGPDSLAAIGNTLYFAADDGIHGQELWKSDGTSDGTVLVKDINVQPVS